MQNPWHESKTWRLHSADEELPEAEGYFGLSPLMSDIIITIHVWCSPAMCCCMSWQGKTPAAVLQKQSWWLHLLHSTGWPYDSTWQCVNGRLAQHWAQTVCILTFVVEQRVQQLLFPLLLIFLCSGLLLLPYHYLILTTILAISLISF